MRILYVEDNEMDAELLLRYFGRKHPQDKVDWVSSYSEAINQLSQCSPEKPVYDLVLTDMHLPDGSGISLAPFIQDHLLDIAVVLLTGAGNDELVVAALKAGARDYVVKRDDYLAHLPSILENALLRHLKEKTRRSHRLRVLYAEHLLSDVDLTRQHFARYAPNFSLEVVNHANEVLKRLAPPGSQTAGGSAEYDLFLCDYQLLGMNGLELIKELFQHPEFDLPIIMVTGHSDEEIALQSLRLGAVDYVVKTGGYLNRLPVVLENAFHRAQLTREQDALRRSEEYYRSLIENASDIITVLDGSGIIHYQSPAVERVLDYQMQSLTGKPLFEILHPEDIPLAQETFKQLLHDPETTNLTFEARARHKDGSWRYLESTGSRLKDPSGQSMIVINSRDITGRKKSEQALNRRANQLAMLNDIGSQITVVLEVDDVLERSAILVEKLFEYYHVGLFTLDSERNELVLSAKAGEFTKIYPLDHTLKTDQGIVGWVSRNGKTMLANDVQANPYFFNNYPDQVPTLSELSVPIQVSGRILGILDIQSPKRDAFDENDVMVIETLANQIAIAMENARLFQAAQQELAERKRVESALRESEERYRAFVSNSTEGIWRFETEPAIQILLPENELINQIYQCVYLAECNDTMANIYGFSQAEEMIGSRLDIFLSPSDPRAIEFLKAFIHSGYRLTDIESAEVDDDGQTHFYINTLIGFIEDGCLVRAWGMQRDVTENKQRERELEMIVHVSTALRSVPALSEMMALILEQVLDLFGANGAAFAMRDPSTNEAAIELVRGDFAGALDVHLPAIKSFSNYVFLSGAVYQSNDFRSNPQFSQLDLDLEIRAVLCLPLIAYGEIIGALWVGRRLKITESEVRLITAIADIAANAIHRAKLYEKTERNVQRLAALHDIDTAISSSLDLQVTLRVLLEQVMAQLHVDAADVLLLNPHLHVLEFVVSWGFRTRAIERTHLRLGEGYAGRAAMERITVHIANLPSTANSFTRSGLLAAEGFVTYFATPLVAKGQVKGVLEIYHRAALTPDKEWLDFLETLAGQTAIAIDNATLFRDLQRSNLDLAMAYDETIEGWSRALDLRDRETEGHTQRVTEITEGLARMIGMSDSEIVQVRRGALLHDIGKMAVPDTILLKPGPLSEEEWVIMRKHPEFAFNLLYPVRYLRLAIDIPHCHHERWDGSGYPRGLKGEQIPLGARLFAIVDVWDALRSDRPYRQRWPDAKVHDYLRNMAGSQFDPQLVAQFLKFLEEGNG